MRIPPPDPHRGRFFELHRHNPMTYKTLARQTVSGLIRGRSSFEPKEYSDVAPQSPQRLDSNSGHPLSPFEPAPSRGSGSLELRHGPGSLLWFNGRGQHLGSPPQLPAQYRPRTTARLVQGGRRQVGRPSPRTRRDDLLRPVAAVDPHGLALPPLGRGSGRHQPVRPSDRAVAEHRLPRDGDPGGLEGPPPTCRIPGSRNGRPCCTGSTAKWTPAGPWWS